MPLLIFISRDFDGVVFLAKGKEFLLGRTPFPDLHKARHRLVKIACG